MNTPNSSAIYRPDLRDAVVQEWDVTGEQGNFVAERALPMIEVPTAGGTYKRIPREAMTKDGDDGRAPNGGYSESALGDEDVTFSTIERGHAVPIDANLSAQASVYYDAEVIATSRALSFCYRQHEKRVATDMQSASIFSGATAAGTAWGTAASGTPIHDVRAAAELVRKQCGLRANTLLLARTLWEEVMETTEVLGRINGGAAPSDPASMTPQIFAGLCGLQEVIIADGVKDSANEGQAFTGADIWDATKALVYFKRPNPSLGSLQLGGTYHWSGDGSLPDFRVERYWEESIRRWVIRARRQVRQHVQYPECGYLLTGLS